MPSGCLEKDTASMRSSDSANRRGWLVVAVIPLVFSASATGLAMGGASIGDVSPSGHAHTDLLMLVVYVLLALVFSFLCSVAEAVLLSLTPSYIAGVKARQPKLAVLLKRLKQEKVDQSLAAILTLNTIAHTVGAIGAGAKATAVFGSAWFGLFSAAMTLMILFLSEILPKTVGALYWRSLAGPTAQYVRALIVLLYPLIWISEKLTRLIARGEIVSLFNKEEFLALARIGEQSGHIDADESRIIRNLFRLDSLKAEDVMTPRTVMVALKESMSLDKAVAFCETKPFSRIPIYGENQDDITGFVLRDELLLAKAQGQGETRLAELKRELATIVSRTSLSDLLEMLLHSRRHIALVVDEYGGTRGIVTLEDVVETLLGIEILDELDTVADMQALARQKWAERAKRLGLELDHSTEDEPSK